jgi:nucleoside-diphosphate-sugar epimerase
VRTVLITGGTGVIGSRLVPLYLEDPDTSVRLLIRGHTIHDVQDRLRNLLAFWGLDAADPTVGGRLQALLGDVSRPHLGLDRQAYEQLTLDVTHLVHAAGNVKLNQSPDEARASAVGALQHVIDLALAARASGQLRKIDVVSTVGVAGRRPGLVPEQLLPGARQFRNTYEAAKAEAEDLLARYMQDGLPATIHRPSMVVGDSKTGEIVRFQVFYHLCEFLCGRRTFGVVPDTGKALLDIIPVDFVARAIHIASGRGDLAGRVLHLCSGPAHAVRITALIEQLNAIFRRSGAPVPRLRWIRYERLRLLLPILGTLAAGRTRRALRSLPFFLAYLQEPQVFDNSRTSALLADEGLAVPCVADYLEPVVEYYLASTGRSVRTTTGVGAPRRTP